MGCKQPQACSTNYFNNFRNATHSECDMNNEFGNDNISVCRQCCGGFDINGNSLQEKCNFELLTNPFTTNEEWADNTYHGAVLTDSNGQNGFNPVAFASFMNNMIAAEQAAAAAAAAEGENSEESAEEKSYSSGANWSNQGYANNDYASNNNNGYANNNNNNGATSETGELPFGFGTGLGDNYAGNYEGKYNIALLFIYRSFLPTVFY